MNTSAIVAIIMGVLMMVLSFVLYPTLNNAMDDLYLYWVDSCSSGNERFIRAYVGVKEANIGSSPVNAYVTDGDTKGTFYGNGITVTGSSGKCTFAASSATGLDGTATPDGLYNERGNKLSVTFDNDTGTPPVPYQLRPILSNVATTPPGSVAGEASWVEVPSLLDQFGGTGRLVLSVMPIMVLASFLGLVAMGLIDYGRGMSQGGIAGAVGAAIIQLIVVIVLLEVLPTVIDAMVDANQSATGGRFTVNDQFQGIMGIIFAALPLLLVVGILGISGFMLFQKGRNFRAGGGFSFGG